MRGATFLPVRAPSAFPLLGQPSPFDPLPSAFISQRVRPMYRPAALLTALLFLPVLISALAWSLGLGQNVAAQEEGSELRAAVAYDAGGRFDKSFNEAAFRGASQFDRETGLSHSDYEIGENPTPADRVRLLEEAVADGHTLVIATGFSFSEALKAVAESNPGIRFAIIDSVVDAPNVQSITFKEHEGSYLVGVVAGMASQSKVVGFVGGQKFFLIERFKVGFTEGVHSVDSSIKVLSAMASDHTKKDQNAFNVPFIGGLLAADMIDQGADVVYAAAGVTGLGAYMAAKQAGVKAIGVDSNQNYLHPGVMLTSMVKRSDLAVYTTMMEAHQGQWQPGHKVLGLKEGGVEAAFDKHNAPLITDAMRQAVEKARTDIIAGRITVTHVMP